MAAKTTRETGALWALVERYASSQRYRPSVAQIADEMGVSAYTVTAWKYGGHLPRPEHLWKLADVIGVTYRVALDAAMKDSGYARGVAEFETIADSEPLPEPDSSSAPSRRGR